MAEPVATETAPIGNVAQDASDAAKLVKRSLTRLFGQIAEQLERPAHLQRYLGIDSKLAWQVFRTANAEDLLDAARHVPSSASMQRFVKAALEKGLAAETLRDVEAAVATFDEVSERHGGDRATFYGMVAALQGDTAATFAQQRRSAFRANSQLWGCQIGTFFGSGVLRRNADGTIDCVKFGAKTNFRRFRFDSMPPVIASSQRAANGEMVPDPGSPVDPEAYEVYGVPLLPQFCSKPIPHFKKTPLWSGWSVHMVDNDQLGCTSAIDLVFALKSPQLPPVRWSNGQPFVYQSLTFRQPTELAVLELLVHRPSFGTVTPQYRVLPDDGGNFVAELERSKLYFPTDERVMNIGPADEAPPFRGVPQYPQIAVHVLGEMGWNPAEFDVYRVKMEHPIMNTTAALSLTIE